MTNIKTTVGGVAAGLALIAGGVSIICKGGDLATGISGIVAGLAAFWTGFHAADAVNPS